MRSYDFLNLPAGLLMQVAGDVNTAGPRADQALTDDWGAAGAELPDQGFSNRTTLLPGRSTFQLPGNLTQLWHDVETEDSRPFLANGQPNPTKGQKVKRRMLKFDKAHPLVVVGGKYDGLPMTATFSNSPRPRGGKKDDPKTVWVSDLAYLSDIGLQGNLPADKRNRPKTVNELEALVNSYAGKTIQLEHGLSAQCNPEKVRYVEIMLAEGPVRQPDPTGQKGCGTRYYTKDFKNPNPAEGQPLYDMEMLCKCGAIVRGFENVETILAPLGS